MNNKNNSKSLIPLTALICLLLLSTSAFAHKVNMFAYAEGNNIFMEGYFADGKKAKRCEVTVFNSQGEELHAGLTDVEGQYQFAIPEMTDLKIVLNAGMGHQASFLLPVDELKDEEDSIQSTVNTDVAVTISGSGANINAEALGLIVDQAVAKAVRPVMRSIAEMREEKSFSSIIGGIGFIFGMMGLYFYMKAKKDFNSPS